MGSDAVAPRFLDVSAAVARLRVDTTRILKGMLHAQERVRATNFGRFQHLYEQMRCLESFLASFVGDMEGAFRTRAAPDPYEDALGHDVLHFVAALSAAVQVSSTSMTEAYFVDTVRTQLQIACASSLARWHHDLTDGGFVVDDHSVWLLYHKLIFHAVRIGVPGGGWAPRLRDALSSQFRAHIRPRRAIRKQKALRRRREAGATALVPLGSARGPSDAPPPRVVHDLNDDDDEPEPRRVLYDLNDEDDSD